MTQTLNILTLLLGGGCLTWNVHVSKEMNFFITHYKEHSQNEGSFFCPTSVLISMLYFYITYILSFLSVLSAWICRRFMCTAFETDRVSVYHCLERVIIHLPCFFTFTWTLCILHHHKWKQSWKHCFPCLFKAYDV